MNDDLHLIEAQPIKGAKLIVPSSPARYGDFCRLAAWSDLPSNLKRRFDPKGPMYKVTTAIVMQWRQFVMTFFPGFYWDGSSVPLVARVIGVSRWSKNLELFPCSLFHDGVWRGLIRLTPGWWSNAYQGNIGYRDLAVAAGYGRRGARFHQRVLDAAIPFGYRPIHEPNQEVIQIVDLLRHPSQGVEQVGRVVKPGNPVKAFTPPADVERWYEKWRLPPGPESI